MLKLYKHLFAAALVVSSAGTVLAQAPSGRTADRVITFRFVPGEDTFYIPWEGNGEELTRLYSLVEQYREQILSGAMPVRVDGYCASLPTAKENLNTAYVRANRVKSELILNKGLREEHFVTGNHTTPYTDAAGTNHRDIVVVTLRIPAKAESQPAPGPKPEPVKEQPEQAATPAEPEPEPEKAAPVPLSEATPIAGETAVTSKPSCLALRTNLLYDAFLLPTLGIEWRVSREVGITLDGSRSWWGEAGGKVQKIWLVSPQVRWYLFDAKRFYVGASGTVGRYNVYKHVIGGLFSSDTGYQGKLWNAGASVGYQLYLSGRLSLDFNLGLGYTYFNYDSFNVTEGVRIYNEKDKTKVFWGPTGAGISLVWTIGGHR